MGWLLSKSWSLSCHPRWGHQERLTSVNRAAWAWTSSHQNCKVTKPLHLKYFITVMGNRLIQARSLTLKLKTFITILPEWPVFYSQLTSFLIWIPISRLKLNRQSQIMLSSQSHEIPLSLPRPTAFTQGMPEASSSWLESFPVLRLPSGLLNSQDSGQLSTYHSLWIKRFCFSSSVALHLLLFDSL